MNSGMACHEKVETDFASVKVYLVRMNSSDVLAQLKLDCREESGSFIFGRGYERNQRS
jgi:hypothetical protein